VEKGYFDDPIVAAYFHILARLKNNDEIDRYLKALRDAEVSGIWLFVRNVDRQKLDHFLDQAHEKGMKVVPVFQPNVSIKEHPEVKIVCSDGSTSDNPRYSNIGCFNHPYLMEKAKEMIAEFLEHHKDHPVLYSIGGLPLLSFIHEAYYRTDVPEFGGGPFKPCCYCRCCIQDFRETMKQKYGDIGALNSRHQTGFASWEDLQPPREPSNASFWKEWFDYHAEIIPNFLRKLIEYARSITPIASTHELNDFYPCTYQCVYSGNDLWRMAAVLDVGHEDMYPLEFDHRYVIYVYEYPKDALRTAMGFDKLYTGNGQSFNSWLGYKVPPESMSEQIYSTLAHGALGLVWWVDWGNLDLWSKTTNHNKEFSKLVKALRNYELSRAEISLIYPWTSMELKTDDTYSMDNMLFYMALIRSGFPVDIVSEDQIAEGLLEKRGYKVVCAVGCPTLPPEVATKIQDFVRKGGTLIADYEGEGVDEFRSVYPDLIDQPVADYTIYTVRTNLQSLRELDGKIIPVSNRCEKLMAPQNAEVLATFENGDAAIIRTMDGKGSVFKVGSLLGWDYSNYPGHYDFAAMFPFLIRRNETVRKLISGLLKETGVQPPVESSNPDVEVGAWKAENKRLVIVVNHLDRPSETRVSVDPGREGKFKVWEIHTGDVAESRSQDGRVIFDVNLTDFRGKAFVLERE